MTYWVSPYPVTATATPTVADQTFVFGADTLTNAGGTKAIASDGTEVDITSVTYVSGPLSTGWSVSSGRVRQSGSLASASGTVLSCVTALGTFQATISTIANGYSAASIADIQAVINLARQATNPGGYTTALAGKTMYVRPGSYDTRDDNLGVTGLKGTMNYRNAFLNQTGMFTIRPHGAQWSAIFNFWRIWIPDNRLDPGDPRSANITFKDIYFYRSMESYKTLLIGGEQLQSLVRIDFGNSRDLTFDGCKFGSDMEPGRTGAFKNYSHYPIGIGFDGSSCNNLTVKNCIFTQLSSGVTGMGGNNIVLDGNEFYNNVGDFMQIGDATNFAIRNNVWHDGASDGVYHPDFIQGYTFAATTTGPGVVEGNIIYPGYETPRGVRGSTATAAVLDGNRMEINTATNVFNSDQTITCDGSVYGGGSPVNTNGKTISCQNGPPVVSLQQTFALAQLSAMPSGYTVSFCKRNGTDVAMVISPYAGDTINGATSSVTLNDFYESARFVKNTSTDWTMTLNDARNGPVLRFADFTMTSDDWSRVFCVDASAGPVTVYLPQASTMVTDGEFEIHKFDTSTNTVTIVPYAGDTYINGSTISSSNIVLRYMGRMYGFKARGTSQWTITTDGGVGEPQGGLWQSRGGEVYTDITFRGNLFWLTSGHMTTFESSTSNTINIQFYNNTFVSPRFGDIDGDGLLHTTGDGSAQSYIATYAIGANLNTFGARNVWIGGNHNLALDNILINPGSNSTYTAFFAGNNIDTDYYPITRQQAVDMARPRSVANNKYGAVGTSDGLGYWNFETKSANPGFGDAPTVLSTIPVDGSLSLPVSYNMVANFSQPIAKGTGNIILRQKISGSWTNAETFDAASSARLTFEGNKLTIDPTSDLVVGREYAIRIAPTAVVSKLYGTPFAGIADDTTWSFTAMVASSQNLLTGSNSFDGTNVWTLFSGTGSTTLTSTANTETGEPYSRLSSTASGPIWRYDTDLSADAGFTPAGSTAYTFTIYVKKDSSAFNLNLFFRTLGGTDQSSSMSFNTNTGVCGTPSGTLSITTFDRTVVATDEYRLRVLFTTSASTSRILWELQMPTGTNNVLVSCSKVSTAGLDAYSPGY